MPITVTQSAYAVTPDMTASFLAVGGTAPYIYSVVSGGAGGTINPTTGVYTAPATAPTDVAKQYATIKITDALAVSATAQILVGTPLILFCDILRRQLGLENERVYLWDQKIMQPTNAGLYVAVSLPDAKPFSNINRQLPSGTQSEQIINMLVAVGVDIISRDASARDRKEEVLMALNSTYSAQQQAANSFYIAPLPYPARFINLSEGDGAAIPYRYRITVNMQYASRKVQDLQYFDEFTDAVYTNP